MICKNCGHDNKDGARICESCGASLVKEKDKTREKIKISKEDSQKRSQRQQKRAKDKDLMTYGMILGSVMAFAVIFIVLSYFFKLGANREMARNTQVEQSIEENQKLYEKAIKTSEENIKNKDYPKAIKILKAIPEDAGDYYKKGQDQLKELEKTIIADIKKAQEDGDEKEAEKLASRYADLLPESKAIVDLKEKIVGKTDKKDNKDEEKETSIDDEEDKKTSEEDTEETDKETTKTDEKTDSKDARANRRELAKEYDLEALRINNSYGQNGNPSYTEIYKESDFLNKDLKIDAHMGEIRTEANLNSGVAGYVYDGDKVHCEEVVDDGGRYWLKIDGGWISSKLVTGEFRD